MYKWVRVYISLKLFKRGDPPIVLDELWHQNLNKEIFVWDYSSVYLVNDLMISHCYSSTLSFVRDPSCIFSFAHFICRKGGTLGEREGGFVRELTIVPALGCLDQGVFLSWWFLTSYLFFILQFLFVCLIIWFSLIWQVEGGVRVTGCDSTTSRSSLKKLIWMGKWHSSSFMRSSARSKYVS